ncbi:MULTISPECIES: DP-EP family protein [unclassified Pseudoalteromonas]|uniref:DP-EP family protein n=1 Tax=unclassified Pseudoalteromonas TaxID=194690 RepID=UPI0025B5DD95|nr:MULTISPECIES: DP-EP family protein [unclassified Pseudoalteromonas]MDN3376922.1 DP-EP family protein [Pseudoalteromonas sp. APC 3893]MDN3387368.1 DP-EP family protein [Pseudoalteromonas sp. APC 4017]
MNTTQEQINFTVNIELDSNDKANFTYFKDNKEVTGGGVVRTETAGIYSLNEATLAKGFLFTGATITDKEGNCASNFTTKVNDNGQAITIIDTDENPGTACLVFHVECNEKPYSSPDPQVINEKEL